MYTGATTTGTTPTATPIGSTSTSAASTTTFTSSNDASSKTKVYMTSTGSLNVTLQLFNPNITIPYSDNDELKADLTEVAKLLVINVIKSSTEQYYGNEYTYYDNSNGTDEYYQYDNNFNRTDDLIMSEMGNSGPENSTMTRNGNDKVQFVTEESSDVPVLRYVSHGHGHFKFP